MLCPCAYRKRASHQGVDVDFAATFNAQSLRTSFSADISTDAGGPVADYRNSYQYDKLFRLVQIGQTGQTGGNAVTEKRFLFEYDTDSRLAELTRQLPQDSAAVDVSSSFAYDGAGRLQQMTHQSDTQIHDYQYQYDVANRLTLIGSSANLATREHQLTRSSRTC